MPVHAVVIDINPNGHTDDSLGCTDVHANAEFQVVVVTV